MTLTTGAMEAGQRVKHVKRISYYTVIGKAALQAGSAVLEPSELIIYRGDDGKLWARPSWEFEDGRFEKVYSPITTPADAVKENEMYRQLMPPWEAVPATDQPVWADY